MAFRTIDSIASIPFCFCLLLCFSAQGADDAVTKFEGKGYTIAYPQGWDTQTGFMGTDSLALSPMENTQDTFRENLNVVIEETPKGVSRAEYLAATKTNLAAVFGKDCILKMEETIIDGIPSTVFEYTGKMGVMDLHNNAYVIFQPGRAFVITCSTLKGDSREAYLAQLDKIARSFAITPVDATVP